jgi:CheY-like chemotaxis protein
MGFDGASLKVLVIEHNQHFRQLIRTVLSTLGVGQVEEVNDGTQALSRLRRFAADVVIADWKMEPMDGILFTHSLRRRADSPNPFLPIIMVAGSAEAAMMAEARDAGVDEFLIKPFSARNLIGRITSVIVTPRDFVSCETYVGPDRRRRLLPFVGAERRRCPATVVSPQGRMRTAGGGLR